MLAAAALLVVLGLVQTASAGTAREVATIVRLVPHAALLARDDGAFTIVSRNALPGGALVGDRFDGLQTGRMLQLADARGDLR